MKLKHALLLTAALIVTPLLRAGDLPAPLPELMNDEQAAKWTAAQEAAAPTTASANEPSTQFYTGKPYVADAGGYVYKYRTYNPEMSRWTSADPSGFPNGVNNFVYAPISTCGFDPDGRFYSGTSYTGVTADMAAWNSIEYLYASSDPMAVEAMKHADGTTPGNWTLSSTDTSAIQASSDYTTKYSPSVQTALGTSPSSGPDSTPVNHFLFTHGTDEYYAFGHADLSTSGTIAYDASGNWTYSATVTLSDTYSFAAYSSIGYFTPTGLGYRLEHAGYLKPFSSSGTWTDTWHGSGSE